MADTLLWRNKFIHFPKLTELMKSGLKPKAYSQASSQPDIKKKAKDEGDGVIGEDRKWNVY